MIIIAYLWGDDLGILCESQVYVLDVFVEKVVHIE